MTIEINQVKSNFSIEFEVRIDDYLTYTAKSSVISSMGKNTLMDINGEIICFTKYQLFSDFENITSSQKHIHHSDICSVIDADNCEIGAVSKAREGDENSFYCLKYKGSEFRIHIISIGAYEYSMIFKDDVQIAQINKTHIVESNLDRYVLYLLDEFSEFKETFILYTIYYDSHNYDNRGEFVISGTESLCAWSYGESNKLYNPEWLYNHFGIVSPSVTQIDKRMEKILKILSPVLNNIFIIAMIIAAIYFLFFR